MANALLKNGLICLDDNKYFIIDGKRVQKAHGGDGRTWVFFGTNEKVDLFNGLNFEQICKKMRWTNDLQFKKHFG